MLIEFDEAYTELMEELGRTKCNVCYCWVVNLKRHMFSKKHNKRVMWNIQIAQHDATQVSKELL